MSELESDAPEDLVGVGETGARSVRLWLRSRFAGTHSVALWPDGASRPRATVPVSVGDDPACDRVAVVCYPAEAAGANCLEPSTRYRYSVTRASDLALVGEGQFETAPICADSAPEQFAFALASCNQPFDDAGRLRPESLESLAAAERTLAERRVKRVLFVGDQVYADYPRPLSLFDRQYFACVGPKGRASILDCRREEVREIYQLRHRAFWKPRSIRRIFARYPCAMMLDDHEIMDNFGSHPAHSGARFAALREGALDAFYDYQGRRFAALQADRPRSMHFSFEYGPVAVFMMDIRSEKRADDGKIAMYGETQFAELALFLEQHAAFPIVLVGVSVPLVFLPARLARLAARLGDEDSDSADRWGNAKAQDARDRLIRLLRSHQRRHPEQRIALVSGDVHTGFASQLSFADGLRPLYQFVSSPISNLEEWRFRRVAEALPRIVSGSTFGATPAFRFELVPAERGKNPFSRLNLGIVVFERAGRTWTLRFELWSADERGEPYLAYRSPEL